MLIYMYLQRNIVERWLGSFRCTDTLHKYPVEGLCKGPVADITCII